MSIASGKEIVLQSFSKVTKILNQLFALSILSEKKSDISNQYLILKSQWTKQLKQYVVFSAYLFGSNMITLKEDELTTYSNFLENSYLEYWLKVLNTKTLSIIFITILDMVICYQIK